MKTRFLDVADVVRLVDRIGLAVMLERMAAAIRDDFRRWPEFDKTARVASHSPGGVIELMPVADGRRHTFKYVNGHPGNTAAGLPTVMAFGALADVATGRPLLLSELTLTTAMRTAATSVVAARAMARPGARTMAVIGNGAQSEFQALAFAALCGIREVRLYDVDPRATARLADRLRTRTDLAVTCAPDVARAIAGADVVTTLTADQRRAVIVTPAMVEPGMHINAVGGDSPGKTELHPDVLRDARIVVEFEPQSRIEGEIQQLPPERPVFELWEVLSGRVPGRTDGRELTVFDSVGFALEDHAALRLLLALSEETGIGRDVQLVPSLQDPKDLFALLRGPNFRAEPPQLGSGSRPEIASTFMG